MAENEGTRIVRMTDVVLRRPPPGAREAFTACYPRLQALSASLQRPAVLALAVDGWGKVVSGACVEVGQALIIGRHTNCGQLLEADSIALRHLALLVSAGEQEAQEAQEAPVTRLWDLNTGQLFTTEDGQRSAAVVSQGMLYATVGPYALLFVPARPSWPATASEAWAALPPRRFLDRRTPDASVPAHPRRARLDGGEWQTEVTRVTHIAAVSQLSNSEKPRAPVAELKLSRGATKVAINLSARRLDEGLLLGRYSRCGITLDVDRVSRVHLLLVRVEQDVWALDTASTNGVFRESGAFTAAPLLDQDEVWLGEDICVGWRRL